MKKKLFSKIGFTLSEVLIAVLILGLVSTGVAVGISSSLRVYKESTETSDAQMLLSTLSQAVMDELRYADNIQSGSNPGYTSANYGSNARLQPNNDGHIAAVSGGSSIIGTGAYNDMKATISYSYDSAENLFSVTLTVTDSAGAAIRTAQFDVAPIA